MTDNTTPNEQQTEAVPAPASTAPTENVSAARPWFKKKRFIIPIGIFAFFVVAGLVNGAGAEPSDNVSSDRDTTTTEPSTAPEEEDSPAEDAESAVEEAEAAEEAEAEAAAEEEARAAAEAQAAEEAAEEAAEQQAAEEEAARVAAEEAAAAAGSVSQQNALRSAENYLSFTAFSRTGLIGQLEFEGYPTEDATWAVDRVEVDWNEQAAKSAANYLDFTSFSRSGLIDQLIFEGFTPQEAEYGVNQTGL